MQVTASHNPPQDNGLKVYLTQGAQLVSPQDTEIEAAIAAARPARSPSTPTAGPRPWPDDLVQAYLDRAGSLARSRRGQAAGIRVAITPMHGVGGETAVKALHLAGFTDVHVVPEQAAPDGDFPTVPFPNPEEHGRDRPVAGAGRSGSTPDIAIALDPDADRCALGIPLPDGGWRMLTGDETGALLGDHVLRTLDRAAHPDPLVATTIVSGELLRSIAAAARRPVRRDADRVQVDRPGR